MQLAALGGAGWDPIAARVRPVDRPPIARRLGLAALLLYSALLVAAATKPPVLPAALAPIQHHAERVLARAGIEAGRTVFVGDPSSPWIPRTLCLRIVTETAGVHHLLFACDTPLFRPVTDTWRHVTDVAARELYRAARDGHGPPPVAYSLAAWACWSDQVPGRADRVALLVQGEAMQFLTNERAPFHHTALWFECAAAGPAAGPWPAPHALLGSAP